MCIHLRSYTSVAKQDNCSKNFNLYVITKKKVFNTLKQNYLYYYALSSYLVCRNAKRHSRNIAIIAGIMAALVIFLL